MCIKQTFTLLIICCLTALPLKAQLIAFDTLQTSTVTDVEGNVYKTIRFGDTWWMAENLRTKHYNNGAAILQATTYIDDSDGNTWDYWTNAPRWCYTQLKESNSSIYGLQYTWRAALNICPTGWELPDTTYWFTMGRLISGSSSILTETVTRNTPQGGTETVYEPLGVLGLGRYLKSDNGKKIGTNRYGDETWVDGGYWQHNDTLSNVCDGTGMTIFPAGAVGDDDGGFGKDAFFWTPNYVHADSSGQGKRAVMFSYENHDLAIAWFHNANMTSVRCVKKVSTTTGLATISTAKLVLYPNPANDYIRVSGASGTYRIVSSAGMTLRSGVLGDGNTTISLEGLNNGFYLIQVGNQVQRFIKQ